MIDSHCHVDSEQFDPDREAVIERALSAGVTTMLAIGTGEGPPQLDAGIQLADQHACFVASVGVHPHSASRVAAETYSDLRTLAAHQKCVAIGEIGLDYHYDFSPRDQQREVFIKQLELAKELKLPIIIHTREAWADTVEILRQHWDSTLGGIFHCFSEGAAEAEEAVALNFHFGFGGVITYPKADRVREAASTVPLDRLLLETDAPYLAPVPHRGKRNEPAYVVETAQRLAALRGLSVAALDTLTTTNFRRLFSAKLEQFQ
ncbi:TatD family hydrolase [Bryobacter aggregatus]|uniref:TatD family hydrolase n=1 Tax=Bryobacter aggregatus TaxID=360054 RepID=UPI0004E1234F|nr:TatD family hydrolase [Bryobacter aggregatus]